METSQVGVVDRWNFVLPTPRGDLVGRRDLLDGHVVAVDKAVHRIRKFPVHVFATLVKPTRIEGFPRGLTVWGHPEAGPAWKKAGATYEPMTVGLCTGEGLVPMEATSLLCSIEHAVGKGARTLRILGVDSSFSFHELQHLIAMRVTVGLKLGLEIQIPLPRYA